MTVARRGAFKHVKTLTHHL